jgi:hypothetical protein
VSTVANCPEKEGKRHPHAIHVQWFKGPNDIPTLGVSKEKRTMPSASQPTGRVPGLITADTLYTLHELKLHLGLGTHAMRSARRSGLKVRYVGRRALVLGRDVIEFVEKCGKARHDSSRRLV